MRCLILFEIDTHLVELVFGDAGSLSTRGWLLGDDRELESGTSCKGSSGILLRVGEAWSIIVVGSQSATEQ